MKKIKLTDIQAEVKVNFILCNYVDPAGNTIKMKYQFYKLSEAKKRFLNYLKTSF